MHCAFSQLLQSGDAVREVVARGLDRGARVGRGAAARRRRDEDGLWSRVGVRNEAEWTSAEGGPEAGREHGLPHVRQIEAFGARAVRVQHELTQ